MASGAGMRPVVPWTARAPPLWAVLGLLLAWGAQRLLPLAGFPVPEAIRGVGVGLLFAGLGMVGWSVATMRRQGTSPEPRHTPTALVMQGPYAHTRNPIYLGMVMAVGGLGLTLGWWWGVPAALLSLLLLDRLVVRHEEATMAAGFGAAWQAYAARVPRWGWRRATPGERGAPA